MTLPPPTPGTAQQAPCMLGYDPFDRTSFPYGMTEVDLILEPMTIETAGDIDPIAMVADILGYDNDGPPNYRMLDMACRLFAKIGQDEAFNDIPAADLFAACCHTARIWEFG